MKLNLKVKEPLTDAYPHLQQFKEFSCSDKKLRFVFHLLDEEGDLYKESDIDYRVADAAKKAGITSPLAPIPSLALGTKPVSVLDMVRGYSAFANGGYRVSPHFITKVVDAKGKVIFQNEPSNNRSSSHRTFRSSYGRG